MRKGQRVLRKDLSGNRFGRLLVIEPLPPSEEAGKPRKFLCLCDCGNKAEVRGTNLSYGTATSCGCYNYEKNQKDVWKKSIGRGPQAAKVQHLNKDKLSFKDFCAQYGLSTKVVRTRLKKGWSPERALKTPVDEDITKRNKNSRVKGRKLEKHVVETILKNYEGTLDEDDVRPVASSCSGVDVQLSKKAIGIFPVSIECKNTVDPPGKKAFEQAKSNCYPNTIPGVVWHAPSSNYEDTILIFKLDDFLALLKELHGKESNN